MRILYVNSTGELGGSEWSLIGLIERLRQTHEIHVACPRGPLVEALERRRVICHQLRGINGGPRLNVAAVHAAFELSGDAYRLSRLVRRIQPDIVHANSLRSAMLSCVRGVNAGTAVVVHVRDRWPRDETTTKLARAWVSRRATGVIANSAYTLDGFVEGISAPGAAAVIHNGVDVDVFDPRRVDGSEARACFAMPATALVMGMAAHMTPWKGQADAIRMVDQLVRSGVDVRLLMAGSVKFQHPGARHDHARYVRDVAGLVRNSVAPDRIHLVGEVADMPTFYAACDVVLVPSLHEPFGRVVIEAMAMARCVVASQNGGPAEIITDGIDGFLLAPGEPEAWADRVGELAADPRLRGRIGAAARETARRSFSSERHADRVAAWYDRLTSPR